MILTLKFILKKYSSCNLHLLPVSCPSDVAEQNVQFKLLIVVAKNDPVTADWTHNYNAGFLNKVWLIDMFTEWPKLAKKANVHSVPAKFSQNIFVNI